MTTRTMRGLTTALLCSTALLTGCDKLKVIKDLPVGTGYAAKQICSYLFVSELDRKMATHQFVAPQVKPLPLIWAIQVDEANKTVAVRDGIFINQNLNTAYYREGVGCTLLHDATPTELDAQLPPQLYPVPADVDAPWPLGEADAETAIPGVDYSRLQSAIDGAFVQDPAHPANTLSVAVVYDGHLVAEQYGLGADRHTRHVSWSMAKSFTATLIGLLADQGKLDLAAPAPVPEWAGTDKSAITLTHLLHMASGLEWSETDQGPTPDRGRMLFTQPDLARYYLQKPLAAEPGAVFNYSTGETNLLARIVQDQLGGNLQDTYHFMHQNLFAPLGISDAVLEFDTVGQPVGGASLYMTARDWAKLGLLYAQQGDWYGTQLLSREWVEFALTPSPANAGYGAQIWLNTEQRAWPWLPEDTFAFVGFQQQHVVVIPSRKLVLVRQGVTFNGEDFDLEGLSAGVLASLPAPDATAGSRLRLKSVRKSNITTYDPRW